MFNNSLWLKVFHHNSAGSVYFTSRYEALNSRKPQKYSILYKINDNFKLNHNGKKCFSFLMEYAQIPQYISWHQTSSIFETGNSSEGYEYQYGNGTWDRFEGLHAYSENHHRYNKTLLSGDSYYVNWFFAIGVFDKEYDPYFPGYLTKTDWLQDVDLWIEVGDVMKLKLVKTVICSFQGYWLFSIMQSYIMIPFLFTS